MSPICECVVHESSVPSVNDLICLQCKEQNVRVDESLFPHTYNPNMTLVSWPCSRYRMDIADCFIYF